MNGLVCGGFFCCCFFDIFFLTHLLPFFYFGIIKNADSGTFVFDISIAEIG